MVDKAARGELDDLQAAGAEDIESLFCEFNFVFLELLGEDLVLLFFRVFLKQVQVLNLLKRNVNRNLPTEHFAFFQNNSKT